MYTITTTDFTYQPEPNKKQILERLFTQGHITFNELWTLLHDDQPDVKYVAMGDCTEPPIWNPEFTTGGTTGNP